MKRQKGRVTQQRTANVQMSQTVEFQFRSPVGKSIPFYTSFPEINSLTALSCSFFSIIFPLSLRLFRESKASSMHFFAFWKQTFSPRKDEKYWLTFDWRFRNLSQSEIRVHWWTHNSKNSTNLSRRESNSTLHQSSHGFATRVHGFATRVHGFATKTKALARQSRQLRRLPIRARAGS